MGRRVSSPLCATSAVGPHLSFSLEVLPFSPGLNSFHIICMGHGFPCIHVHGTWVNFHAHTCMGHGFTCTHVHGTWVSMHTRAWDMGFHAYKCMGHGFHAHTCMGHGFLLCISSRLSLNHRANRNTIQVSYRIFGWGGGGGGGGDYFLCISEVQDLPPLPPSPRIL